MLISEAVQLALIDKVPAVAGAAASICAAFGAGMAGYFSYRAHVIVRETKVAVEQVGVLAKKTEENTNHLHDEIVKVVAAKEFAAGRKQEADDQAANALFLADNPKEK